MNAVMLELVPWVREGYCCSQLLMLMILRAQGVENPGLVRAMGGLCHGMGQSGGASGLLTGGAAALGCTRGFKTPPIWSAREPRTKPRIRWPSP